MLKKRRVEVFNKEFEFLRDNDNYKNRSDNEDETSLSSFDNNDIDLNIKSKRVLRKISTYKLKKQNRNIRFIMLKKYFDKFV